MPSRSSAFRSATQGQELGPQLKVFNLFAAVGLIALTGCLAPPKPHPWQPGRDKMAELRLAEPWSTLSTNDYVRVPEERRREAVALLQAQPFLGLGAGEVAHLAPAWLAPVRPDMKAYLVRGATYSVRPSYTILRRNAEQGRLWVQQFSYNGEMLWPTRWIAEPNAFVVFLDRPPSEIIPDARLGGDWIFRGSDWRGADLR